MLAETSPCITPWSYRQNTEAGTVSVEIALSGSSGASIDICAVYPIASAEVPREDAS